MNILRIYRQFISSLSLTEENDWIYNSHRIQTSFPEGSDGKESACNAGDLGSISGFCVTVFVDQDLGTGVNKKRDAGEPSLE